MSVGPLLGAPHLVRFGGGLMFVGFAVCTMLAPDARDGRVEAGEGVAIGRRQCGSWGWVAAAMLVAEFG